MSNGPSKRPAAHESAIDEILVGSQILLAASPSNWTCLPVLWFDVKFYTKWIWEQFTFQKKSYHNSRVTTLPRICQTTERQGDCLSFPSFSDIPSPHLGCFSLFLNLTLKEAQITHIEWSSAPLIPKFWKRALSRKHSGSIFKSQSCSPDQNVNPRLVVAALAHIRQILTRISQMKLTCVRTSPTEQKQKSTAECMQN